MACLSLHADGQHLHCCERDNLAQANIVAGILIDVVLIDIALSSFCEFVWVLRRVYKIENDVVIRVIRALIASEKQK